MSQKSIRYLCDTEGLRYGTIETPEKYYLSWKEVSEESKDSYLLETTRPIRELADRAEYLLDKIDLWFEAKTKGLTESAKTELKRK